MMMTYGLFVFRLGTVPYQELQRQTDWRHPGQSRVGARPARQFLGPGEDTITLTGTLLPEFTGGQRHLDELRRMAGDGKAWPLIEGTGKNYGLFVLESLNERKSKFFRDGAAGQIDFDMTLQRIDDDDHERLAVLDAATLRLVRGMFA
ncbi:phage tail protein [Billgrantia aerodenitrificans]|uniref:Phage tail protein n=1 Tax=Billgrantia aerodenitrificans TaxID=2733483 RepID=A0ABS9APT7_9GAMM|nr:phage tail protein [Halomonas aerodenitrificans]MCE8023661.1 phage tail protein [Halomonas aerodenitrificans]